MIAEATFSPGGRHEWYLALAEAAAGQRPLTVAADKCQVLAVLILSVILFL